MSKAMLHWDGALCSGPGVIVNVCICDSEFIAKHPESTAPDTLTWVYSGSCGAWLISPCSFLPALPVQLPPVHIINRKHLASLFPGTCED